MSNRKKNTPQINFSAACRVDTEKTPESCGKGIRHETRQESNQAEDSQDGGLSLSILDLWRGANLHSAFFVESENISLFLEQNGLSKSEPISDPSVRGDRPASVDLIDQQSSGPEAHLVYTFFRWTRAPCKSFSDQRNCGTAGPSLRLTNARLPCCILSLRDRSCGAREFSPTTGNRGRGVIGHRGSFRCLGKANFVADIPAI